ncbi:uncharacterized protein BCR38DRAFT_457642 [Pseudomassariella vexata]|uniref:polynucleotide adenylyltransferase n=1 Tax=Pseudomassariella vexata TaxID=1141098 RepID=A0A1Y2E2G1_9PEZI|nr:uncharacterized protein BCR38DRAFT_457642 [Pseudomassariella vexata]ORY65506.1 hypothetical protein BCR38DRAFT_457642 [Pseudomassariella vexata]
MHGAQDRGRPLEDRLRNIILGNVENVVPSSHADNTQASHLRDAQPLTATDGSSEFGTGAIPPPPPTPPQQPVPGTKGAKKRLNQAQRREMSAQLTIPIEPRAAEPGNSFHSPQGFQQQRHGPGYHQKSARAPSAGFRGGFQGHMSATPSVHGHAMPHQQHQHQRGFGYPSQSSPTQSHHPDWRRSQPLQGEPPSRGINVLSGEAFASRPPRNTQGGLYNPGGYRHLLEQLCSVVVRSAEIGHDEIAEKENFRVHIEEICRRVVAHQEIEINGFQSFPSQSVQLKCFGSLSSGFATKAADMDLGLLSPSSAIPPDASESPVPRLIEKALLDAGFGARLLTRTRVPILKLCEKPTRKLYMDLLEERLKWEKGLDNDDQDGLDNDAGMDENEDQDTIDATVLTAQILSTDQQPKESGIPSDAPLAQTRGHRPALLKQTRGQSLASYYGLAKRTLRRMNGCDITHSNAADFTDADFMALDDLSSAFIDGLQDEGLRNRIRAFHSYSAGKQQPNFRSLHGVYMMAEGERLVMIWEAREVFERDSRLEHTHTKPIHRWRELHGQRMFGIDPLAFNKDLKIAADRLHQIPAIQLMQLQQDAYESPAEYYARITKIIAVLSETALLPTGPGKASPVVRCYLAGIRNDGIRDGVEEFTQSTGCQDLRVIARRHKGLHLAVEYEQAIEKDLYRPEDIPVIREYVALLRHKFIQAAPPHQPDYGLPIPATFAPLFDKIRQLPDPSQTVPVQRKDRYHDKLEFPKAGVGVQCDINFSAHLGFQNSLLLRCYSYTDSRVRPLVLFVKHWAKVRGINTPYRGTLSSYGYVLMVLHYLVNVAQPFVCPNLQELAPDPGPTGTEIEGITTCRGRNVRFWRDEQEIQRLAGEGVLNQNRESIGYLLRGFFEYYANSNMMSTIQKTGFDWGRDILSLRTRGGLLSKREKGWTGAKTVLQSHTDPPPTPTGTEMQGHLRSPNPAVLDSMTMPDAQADPPLSPDRIAAGIPTIQTSKAKEFKEVRNRYLFAIEDPFELEHNVARTVTHNGIVSIRDEFRRAWRIIRSTGKTAVQENLLEDVNVHSEIIDQNRFVDLLTDIHGLHP